MSRPIPAIAECDDDNPDDGMSPQAAAEFTDIPHLTGHGAWTPVSEDRFNVYVGLAATGYVEINTGGQTYEAFFIAHPE